MTQCFDFQDKYSNADIEVLEKMHTKQLLKERNRQYKASEYCSDMCDKTSPECILCRYNKNYNREQLKKFLDTREHIPNKKEAKELRKKRIKEGR